MSTIRLTSQERRAAILDAAVTLFAEKGFHATTTRELAARVGVTEPVLYQHFAAKRDLYAAILERLTSTGEDVLPALNSPAREGDERAFLTELARSMMRWHHENPLFLRLLIRSALEGNEFHELMQERYFRIFFDQLNQYFAERIEAGAFRPINSTDSARAFVWMVAQFGMEQTIYKRRFLNTDENHTIDVMIDIFLRGVQA